MTDAERQRLRRDRKRAGQRVFRIVADEVGISEMLIAGGLLAEAEFAARRDAEQMEEALKKQLELLCELT